MGNHRDFVIGCVGKPSAGKSTFFNAVTDGKTAKVGAYPFTTIEANQGITYYRTTCPCKRKGMGGLIWSSVGKIELILTKRPLEIHEPRFKVTCKPHYGTCENGNRTIPIKLLDVAGLIPGASEGLGLGNKFLDDLRHADVLLHILDVSGTTNEKGETTVGYDPVADHDWLIEEIRLWIFNNLWKRWPSITRRHRATESTLTVTLLAQLSGYGAGEELIQEVVNDIGQSPIFSEKLDPAEWDKELVMSLVSLFVDKRFQFILVLNKADLGGDADKNVIRISGRFSPQRVVCSSALTECFLKKMREQGYIHYQPGGLHFSTAADDTNLGLKVPDAKTQTRLENVKDLVLYRLGSTGVHEAIQKAVKAGNLIPAYPIKSLQTFGNDKLSKSGAAAFPECMLIKKGTTVRQFAKILHDEIDRHFMYAEGPNGCRLAEDEVITLKNNIIRFVTHRQ